MSAFSMSALRTVGFSMSALVISTFSISAFSMSAFSISAFSMSGFSMSALRMTMPRRPSVTVVGAPTELISETSTFTCACGSVAVT